jgi:hypothetical protein
MSLSKTTCLDDLELVDIVGENCLCLISEILINSNRPAIVSPAYLFNIYEIGNLKNTFYRSDYNSIKVMISV